MTVKPNGLQAEGMCRRSPEKLLHSEARHPDSQCCQSRAVKTVIKEFCVVICQPDQKKSMLSYPSRERGNPSKQKSTMQSENSEKHLTLSRLPEWRCHNPSLPAEDMQTRHTHTVAQQTHTYQQRKALIWPGGGAEVTSKASLGAPRAQVHCTF